MIKRFQIDGKKVSLLGFGAMRLPTIDGGHANAWNKSGYSNALIDQEELNRQVKVLLDSGVNYFDTSPAYCRGESESRLAEALQKSGYDRDSYIIATKLSTFSRSQWSFEKSKEMFFQSLKNLRTTYLDNYLLHNIGNESFEAFKARFLDNGVLDFLVEQRKNKVIRNLGFSFHGDYKAFQWCIDNHDKYHWDFALIQMNYVDWKHAEKLNVRNVNAERLYNELTNRNIPVVVMEPLLGGRLAKFDYAIAKKMQAFSKDATLASWAFRFCASKPNVMCILSGMTKMEHIEENIATFKSFKPLTDSEFAALESAAQEFVESDYIQCNKCDYCMPCPYGLDIPAILTFYNDYLSPKKRKAYSLKKILSIYDKLIPDELRRAEHCTGCGRCNPHCPQQINVSEEVFKIAQLIENIKDKVFER